MILTAVAKTEKDGRVALFFRTLKHKLQAAVLVLCCFFCFFFVFCFFDMR